jgi:hypothetical protein
MNEVMTWRQTMQVVETNYTTVRPMSPGLANEKGLGIPKPLSVALRA